VFERKIPAARPVDAHDIFATFNIVSDPAEMRRTPSTSDAFLDLVRSRHRAMLADRTEVRPGLFKDRLNRAGGTVFVPPDYVVGTLKHGSSCTGVEPGLARAVFMMFLISDSTRSRTGTAASRGS